MSAPVRAIRTPTTLAVAAALTAAFATAVIAAPPSVNATDAVNAWQTHKEIARAFNTARDALAKPEVDKPAVVANADTLALYAPQIGGWFPRGSGSGAGLKTEARDAIVSDPKGFLDQEQQFEQRTKKFQAIAHNGDVAEMKSFVPQLGASCKSCHDRFKVKDEG